MKINYEHLLKINYEHLFKINYKHLLKINYEHLLKINFEHLLKINYELEMMWEKKIIPCFKVRFPYITIRTNESINI